MRARRPILRCVAVFALLYIVLSTVATLAAPAVETYWRGLARWMFTARTGPRELHFEPYSDYPRSFADTRITIVNRQLMAADGSGPVRHADLPLGRLGGSTCAFLAALILAMPLRWPRRLRALALGLLALHAAIFGVLAFSISVESAEVSLVYFPPGRLAMLRSLERGLLPHLSLVLPLLIWVLVTFRRGDAALFFMDSRAATADHKPLADPALDGQIS